MIHKRTKLINWTSKFRPSAKSTVKRMGEKIRHRLGEIFAKHGSEKDLHSEYKRNLHYKNTNNPICLNGQKI